MRPAPWSVLSHAGRLRAAAVDVYDDEPMDAPTDTLLELDNAVCTRHLGNVEFDQLENYFSVNIERVLAFVAGQPRGVVNPSQCHSMCSPAF